MPGRLIDRRAGRQHAADRQRGGRRLDSLRRRDIRRRRADRYAVHAQAAAVGGGGDVGLPRVSRTAHLGAAVGTEDGVDGGQQRHQREQAGDRESPHYWPVYGIPAPPVHIANRTIRSKSHACDPATRCDSAVLPIDTESGGRTGLRKAKIYRGSRRRLRQIRLRGNGSTELWLLVGWVVFLLLVVLPWMIRQGR